MRALTKLFSDPKLPPKAHFRCGIDGPTTWDIAWESILEESLGYDPDRDYKARVKRLYRLGFISSIPDDWE